MIARTPYFEFSAISTKAHNSILNSDHHIPQLMLDQNHTLLVPNHLYTHTIEPYDEIVHFAIASPAKQTNECFEQTMYSQFGVFNQLKRKLPLLFSMLHTSLVACLPSEIFNWNRMYHAIACFYSIRTDGYKWCCWIVNTFFISSIKNNQIIVVPNSIEIIN